MTNNYNTTVHPLQKIQTVSPCSVFLPLPCTARCMVGSLFPAAIEKASKSLQPLAGKQAQQTSLLRSTKGVKSFDH
ncbi:MAG: hypothetical protein ACI9LE_000509 [Paraglaciecola sp.]|jgi:hypothetical protein